MKKFFEIALGIVTSIGGFLEAGSIATAAQAGAAYSYQLLWAIFIGTLCVIFLIEMAGRLAAVSHHPLPSAVRERFGFTYVAIPLVANSLVDLLVLASELGGACLGLQMLTGLPFRTFAAPVGLLAWGLLWYGNFSLVEYGVSLLGLITVAFIVAAFKLHPDPSDALAGLLPSLPTHHPAHYWFLAVSILGATVSPYLFNFYSSGAVEDGWTEEDLVPNRITATLGMGFGGTISAAVLVCAACLFFPAHLDPTRYEQLTLILSHPLGIWGFRLFGAGLFIACLGAALELSLDTAYVYAQTFGWKWGENQRPNQAARFSVVFSAFLLLATGIVLTGINPMKLTLFSMAATALVLPLVALPFLVLMNDRRYLGGHTNGTVANAVVTVVTLMACAIALVTIPLEIAGGS